jgi:hypothetical protein
MSESQWERVGQAWERTREAENMVVENQHAPELDTPFMEVRSFKNAFTCSFPLLLADVNTYQTRKCQAQSSLSDDLEGVREPRRSFE